MDNLFLLLALASISALVVGIVRPIVFNRFLKERATRKGVVIIFGVATLVFFILFGITTNSTPSDSQQSQGAVITQDQTKLQGDPAEYEVVNSEDVSLKASGNKSLADFTAQELAVLPVDKRMNYRVVVSPTIKENQVRPTIDKIISDITSRDNDIDEIYLFLYSDKALVSRAYDVAMATWVPDGEVGNVTPEIAQNNNRSSYKITIQIRPNLEEYLQNRSQSQDDLGFSEEERRQIFRETVAAQDRAQAEADQLYPTDISKPDYKQENILKNVDKDRDLSDQYEADVRAKYGITKDVELQIIVEGTQENWLLK